MTLTDSLYKDYKYYMQIAFKVVKRRELAEEVLQCVALKLHEYKESVKNIKGFISQLVFNNALNFWQINNNRYSFGLTPWDNFVDESLNQEAKLGIEEYIRKLRPCVERLPKKQKKALKSWYGLGCKINRKPKRINYDTNKANVRWAQIYLKKQLNKEGITFYEIN